MLAVQTAARVAPSQRGCVIRASAQQQPVAPVSRRTTAAVLLGLAALPLLLAAPAEARDAKEAARLAAERKAKLKAHAQKMAESGKGSNAFATSRYGLGEDATTPNMRTLANDRLRKEE